LDDRGARRRWHGHQAAERPVPAAHRFCRDAARPSGPGRVPRPVGPWRRAGAAGERERSRRGGRRGDRGAVSRDHFPRVPTLMGHVGRRAAFLLAALLAALGFAAHARGDLKLGAPAPEVAGERWINSGPLTTRGVQGRVVLVEFWTYG